MTESPRRAGAPHASAMAAIHGDAFPSRDAWDTAAIAAQLVLPGVVGWLDPRGGMLLARMAADEMEVLTLAVMHRARRQGVGTALLGAALSWARSSGVRAAFLEVSITNVAAKDLYARADFMPVGRRARYYADGSDALILRCALSRPDEATGG